MTRRDPVTVLATSANTKAVAVSTSHDSASLSSQQHHCLQDKPLWSQAADIHQAGQDLQGGSVSILISTTFSIPFWGSQVRKIILQSVVETDPTELSDFLDRKTVL
jgi:hypothetical protein